MCGRYATTRSTADLAELFEALDESGGTLGPDYNVAPTDPVPIVRVTSAGHRAVSAARWGLVPAWAKDPKAGARMINARAERVADAPAFARAFARRRCLVPADGWYEWRPREDGRSKQAFFMTPRDGGVLAFAGLWAVWGSGPDRLITCSVVTMAAQGDLTAVHDRMPLTLHPRRWAEWLTGPADPETLLAPPGDDVLTGLEIRPVGPAVGDVRNDGPGLIELVSISGDGPAMTVSSAPDGLPTDLTLF
ncbi:MAG TPA: SOS response-associated peptidase [Rugosimonospora sp.]|nr:SOS response-associated peptidase [Rugosimonospora sp.]